MDIWIGYGWQFLPNLGITSACTYKITGTNGEITALKKKVVKNCNKNCKIKLTADPPLIVTGRPSRWVGTGVAMAFRPRSRDTMRTSPGRVGGRAAIWLAFASRWARQTGAQAPSFPQGWTRASEV